MVLRLFIIARLMGVKWNLIVILIYVFIMNNVLNVFLGIAGYFCLLFRFWICQGKSLFYVLRWVIC